jgi:hypothetical protein
MPWQLNGTFLRVTNNTQEQGGDKLWQQDLEASIKIIATRHDFHDHDLANGISQCLNLNGLNSMIANLNMGGYKIVSMASGTDPDDVPTYKQLAGSMDFDSGLRELTLFDRNGDPIDTVNIPSGSGGGGEGTVSSITVDSTLRATPNPITTTGEIGLKFLATGQTTQNGIQSITIDDYGRVTQVVGGLAGVGTNLSTTYFTNSVRVNSDTGSNATILAANSFQAGVVSTLSQVFSGDKQFNGQIFAENGLTVENGLRAVNLPTSDPAIAGVLYRTGDGTVKVSLG